ncbi:hypothetical protein [Prescottella agglutinans]|uniref:hypothetical protein n=1 Tax=Prescottella agglutinans TaxID=1644129 RepID=UPI003D96A5C5
MTVTVNPVDFELAWPRELLRSELASLINVNSDSQDWANRVEHLLEDAFTDSAARVQFASLGARWSSATGRVDERRQFMAEILRHLDSFPEPRQRRPFWSERNAGSAPGALTIDATAREFDRLIDDLVRRGYFEHAFTKDCVDDPAVVDPSDLIETYIGVPGMWPIDPKQLAADTDKFFDLIEVLHDLVARPRDRYFHNYSGCGWHHSEFSRSAGRHLYVWRVNRLLDRSSLDLRLADSGEDAGRLVVATDDARTELVASMLTRNDPRTGDRVRHAIALFRSRGATEHDKRSAANTLALVLEERWQLLKAELLSADESALFQIANKFAVRHEDGKQQGNYDPVFRDWVFWWYLATVELTDRLIGRQNGEQ